MVGLTARARIMNQIQVDDRIELMLSENTLTALPPDIDAVKFNVFWKVPIGPTVDADYGMSTVESTPNQHTKATAYTSDGDL